MKKYETVLILNQRKVDGDGKKLVNKYEKAIQKEGGRVISTEKQGRCQLATNNDQRRRSGLYWHIVFELDTDHTEALRHRFRRTSGIIRQGIFVYDQPEESAVTTLDG